MGNTFVHQLVNKIVRIYIFSANSGENFIFTILISKAVSNEITIVLQV